MIKKDIITDGDITTVTARFEEPIMTEVLKKCSKTTGLIIASSFIKFLGCKSFAGMSKCDDCDEYSAKKGLDVAEMKLYKKYHDYCAKQYRKILEDLAEAYSEIRGLEIYHNDKVHNIDKDMHRRYLK